MNVFSLSLSPLSLKISCHIVLATLFICSSCNDNDDDNEVHKIQCLCDEMKQNEQTRHYDWECYGPSDNMSEESSVSDDLGTSNNEEVPFTGEK